MNIQAFKDAMVREIYKRPDRDPQLRSEQYMWIKCPFHSGGNENTGSLRLQLNDQYMGQWKCFGCNQTGTWQTLAKKLGLKSFKNSDIFQSYAVDYFTDSEKTAMFREEDDSVVEPSGSIPWNPNEKWRNIKGKTVAAMGGRLYYNDKIKQNSLWMPCNCNGSTAGAISARLIEGKGRMYTNSPGPWSKRNLQFYDEMAPLCKGRWIGLVEGMRDALNLIQYGYPAVSNNGAISTWHSSKVELLLNLDIAGIVIMFDPDEAGVEAKKAAVKTLSGKISLKTVSFPLGKDGKKLMDASDLKRSEIAEIWDSIADNSVKNRTVKQQRG